MIFFSRRLKHVRKRGVWSMSFSTRYYAYPATTKEPGSEGKELKEGNLALNNRPLQEQHLPLVSTSTIPP